MKIIFLLLLALLVFSGCQVKETKSSGGLISDNKPVTNQFTLSKPSAGSYVAGSHIDFSLAFPFNVDVTGTPSVELTVGSSTVSANYLSGTGTKNIVFRYIVTSGDNDTNGISIAGSVSLNSGSLTFVDSAGATANCSLTFTTSATASVLVDTTVPTLGTLAFPSDMLYELGQTLSFVQAYDEKVIVTGAPRIALTIGGISKYATYVSGSGTTSLTFRYTVASADKDLNGIDIVSADLNSGVIKDVGGNIAPFSLTTVNKPGILVQDAPTKILSSTKSADGTYLNASTLQFDLTFNRTVTVSSSPRLKLTIGTATKYAVYNSGSGTATLSFRYTTASPDLDTDGITVDPAIDVTTGSIIDANGDNIINKTFSLASTAGIKVDSVIPAISSGTAPSNATYVVGSNLDFTFTFTNPVSVVGTPSLGIDMGGTTVQGNYLSGSGTTAIKFRYTVQAGDLDANGILLTSISLNGGSMRSVAGNDANLTLPTLTLTGVQVNGVAPTLTAFSAPANSTYLQSSNMNFTATFSRAVTVTGTPRVAFATTDGTKYANYLSGTGTTTLTFRYVVAANAYDYDGIAVTSPIDLNGGSIKDIYNYSPALVFTVPSTTGVLVDASPSMISSITIPTSKTYGDGEILNFTFHFTKNVTITGTPRLSMTLGASTVYATYQSGSGSKDIIFRKIIATPETDTDGIAIASPLQLNSGTIIDGSAIAATLTFTVPNTSGIVIDSGAPYVTSITPPANGTFLANQNLNFVASFNEVVTVTGTPRLVLNIGGNTRYATYTSGSGSTSVSFRYTITTADIDTDGIGINSAIDLNSATIVDTSNNPATITYTAPNLTAVLVDGVLPVISSVTNPSNGVLTSGATLNFTVNFNKPITVSGTPRIALTIGAGSFYANYLSGSGTNALVFRYTLVATNFDLDGIALGNSNDIDLNSGTLKDASGNNTPVNLSSQDLSQVYVSYPGLGAWFDMNDASMITTVFASPNYQISNWNDKSGNTKHASQTVVASRPYYLASGFGSQNRPFGNTNLASHYMNLLTAVPLIQYVIAVYRTPSTLAVSQVWSGSTAIVGYSATGALTFTPTAQYKVNGGALQATTLATGAGVMAINNNYIVSAKFASGLTSTTQRIGHATQSMLNGRIAEILVFTSSASLTDTELTVIHNYLNTKYGIY